MPQYTCRRKGKVGEITCAECGSPLSATDTSCPQCHCVFNDTLADLSLPPDPPAPENIRLLRQIRNGIWAFVAVYVALFVLSSFAWLVLLGHLK